MKHLTNIYSLSARMSVGLCMFFLCPSSHAEESGSGHYVPGGVATLIDSAPTQPGWVIQPIYLRYEGDISGSKTLPVAGLIPSGLEATSDAVTLGGFYTFEQLVLGAHYSVGLYLPYVWMDVTGTLGGFSRTSKSAEIVGRAPRRVISRAEVRALVLCSATSFPMKQARGFLKQNGFPSLIRRIDWKGIISG